MPGKIMRLLALAVGLGMIAIGISAAPRSEPKPEPTPTPPVVMSLDYTRDVAPVATPEPDMSDSELWWLARVMQKESGSRWSDATVMMIGEVVLNRVASPYFPSTVKGVALQEGQYEPFSGTVDLFKPDARYIALAERLMDGERVLEDEAVLYQALFPQADDTFITVYDNELDTVTYFCRDYEEAAHVSQ